MLANHRRRLEPALGALLLAAACANLPIDTPPPFAEYHLRAAYAVPADGRLQLPQSSADLVVHELQLVPQPLRESYDRTPLRHGHWPPGTQVELRCRCRAYQLPNGHLPTPAELLPGASTVHAEHP